MKCLHLVFLFSVALSLMSCSVDDELIKTMATKEEVFGANERVDKVKTEIKEIIQIVEGQSSEIERLQNLTEKYSDIFAQVEIDQKFIAGLRGIDFSEIAAVKAELLEFKLSVQEKESSRKIKSISNAKKMAIQKNKLNVTVSQINSWGDSLVAVIHFPNIGFKTVSNHQAVGNGWEISKIEKTKVSFLHASGKTQSVTL